MPQNVQARKTFDVASKQSGEKRFQCNGCLKTFAQQRYLKRHMLKHAVKGKPHKCDICQARYSDKSNLARHLKYIHDPKFSERFKCIFCAAKSINKAAYMQHLLVHTRERPLFCKLCSHESQFGKTHKAHIKTHELNRKRNFPCELCSKSFFTGHDLRQHILVHTSERAYKCAVCNRSFAQSANLTTHLRIHSKEKPYQCKFCAKKFSRSGDLKRHFRIHTGERPYKCRHFNKSFGQSFSCKRHERTHEQHPA